jgi:type IX secretion system PorP/SprF family membrane protein
MKYISLIIASLVIAISVDAQDLHFADVRQMGQWYNPALKTDRQKDLRANFRNINYQNMMAFKTGSALLNLPLLGKEKALAPNGASFFNLSGGAAFDQSNTGFYKTTVGLLGLSYAKLLSNNNLYASVGFQGAFTNTNYGAEGLFPDQMDANGPIPNSISNDPLRAGRTFKYFGLNAGFSIFKNSNTADWFFGVSVKEVNKPFTESTNSELFKLAPTWGLQAGAKLKGDQSNLDLTAALNKKANASEYLVGAAYNFLFASADPESGSEGSSIGLGCSYRVKDAYIPNIRLQFNKTYLGLYYDINISGIKLSSFNRRGFELVLTQKF